jgi:hypothetical protein
VLKNEQVDLSDIPNYVLPTFEKEEPNDGPKQNIELLKQNIPSKYGIRLSPFVQEWDKFWKCEYPSFMTTPPPQHEWALQTLLNLKKKDTAELQPILRGIDLRDDENLSEAIRKKMFGAKNRVTLSILYNYLN